MTRNDPAPGGGQEERLGSGGDNRRLGVQLRSDVRLMPETVDAAARTVELVWSSGAMVRRRDTWTGKRYDEVLSLEPGHVDLSRLNGGAPLLDTHGAYELRQVLGVVERAWVETDGSAPVGKARVRFSERADVEPVWRDVQAGIIRNVSVGYAVRRFEITEEEGQVPVWRAVDWQPMELSAVPVGADAQAGFRASPDAEQDCTLVRRAAPAPGRDDQDREQKSEAAESSDGGVQPPLQDGKDKEMSGSATESAQGQQARGAEPGMVAGRDATAGPGGPMGAAPEAPAPATDSAARAGHAQRNAPPQDGRAGAPAAENNHNNEPAAHPVSAADMRRIAQEAMEGERARIAGIQEAARKLGVGGEVTADLVRRGVSLDEARGALIDAAASLDRSVDTRPHIRMDGQTEVETRRAAVEAALMHRYEPGRHDLSPAAREWRGLSLIEMAREFLAAEGVRVRGLGRDEIATRALHTSSDFPLILASVTNRTLRAAYEAAPRIYQMVARRTSVADFKAVQRLQLGEAPQLEKVNEAGEFRRGTIGEAKESYRVETYGKVVGITRQVLINDDLDAFTRVPALFGTAAATLESDVVWGIFLQNAAMADGKALFHAGHGNLAASGTALDVVNLARARTAMSRQTGLDGKTLLNIRPAYLVVPSSLELAAEQLLAQNLVPGKPADVVPGNLRSLTIVSEPRLDPASGAVPWYLVASPAAIDTIEYAFLEGQEGVFMETRMGFDVDGVEIKARLDFGAKAIDWRGLYKNPGVALT